MKVKEEKEERKAERAAVQEAEQQFRAERAEQVLVESERKKKLDNVCKKWAWGRTMAQSASSSLY